MKKRLQVSQTANYMPGGILHQANAQANLDAGYGYNSEEGCPSGSALSACQVPRTGLFTLR